jgi:phosphatidylserine/phosphatidylglycerophosphate/cardiolipin synthase-like enzyme
MRKRSENAAISVHAIAGTEVVLLGLNASKKAAKGLLGFQILKSKGKAGKPKPLSGGRDFPGIKSKVPIIQGFMWSDYVVDPKTTYTYRVVPVYGDPAAPTSGDAVEVTISTEDPEGNTHAVYFNRGVAGSQAYSKKFGDYRRWYKDDPQEEDPEKMTFTDYLKPDDVPNREAWNWLSRGLEDAMLGFIAQATGPEYSIRAALYELTYLPVVQAFVDAMERGADVKVVHHAKRESVSQLKSKKDATTTVEYTDGETETVTYKGREVRKITSGDSVCRAANATIARAAVQGEFLDQFRQMFLLRTNTTISHNKFIVLLKNDKPIQLWTGSTNITAGGIFGQSNVGHIIRDETIARKYFEYWDKLKDDPKKKSAKGDQPDAGLSNWTVLQQPDLVGPPQPNSMTAVFSPRQTADMLDWYAEQLGEAKNSVFFTAAFSMADQILAKVRNDQSVATNEPFLRYLLLEGVTGLMRPKVPIIKKCRQNRIAWGETLKSRGEADEFIETLAGLNDHVNYLHTKFMLIDPLSDDPVVITGSANFSENSTVNNDENMVIIRGDTRVADIFLGEFMRLFNHFRSRNTRNQWSDEEAVSAEQLVPNDSWTADYYQDGTQEQNERLLFSCVTVHGPDDGF